MQPGILTDATKGEYFIVSSLCILCIFSVSSNHTLYLVSSSSFGLRSVSTVLSLVTCYARSHLVSCIFRFISSGIYFCSCHTIGDRWTFSHTSRACSSISPSPRQMFFYEIGRSITRFTGGWSWFKENNFGPKNCKKTIHV